MSWDRVKRTISQDKRSVLSILVRRNIAILVMIVTFNMTPEKLVKLTHVLIIKDFFISQTTNQDSKEFPNEIDSKFFIKSQGKHRNNQTKNTIITLDNKKQGAV